jgi:PAS domain S-box-containing protein
MAHQEFLKSITESYPGIILILDQKKVVYLSHAGRPKETINFTIDSIPDIFPKLDLGAAEYDKETTWEYDLIRVEKDSIYNWYQVKSNSVIENDKTIDIYFLDDVSKQIDIQKSQYAHIEYLEFGLESGDVSWWELDQSSGKVRMQNGNSIWSDEFNKVQEVDQEILLDQFHPNDKEKIIHTVDLISKGLRKSDEFESRIKSKNGQWRWVNNKFRIKWSDSPASLNKVLGVFYDVDIRKSYEIDLKTKEWELQNIFDQSTEAIRIIDKDFRIIKANDAYLKMSKSDLSSILGTRCNEHFCSNHCGTLNCPHVRIFNGEDKVENLFTIPKEGELPKHYIYKAFPYMNIDGGKQGIIEYFRDISDIKNSEIAIKQSNDLLQESEKRYKELVQNAKVAIIKLDKKGKIVYFNEYAEELFEYDKEEVIGKSVLETIVPDYNERGDDLKEMVEMFLKNDPKMFENSNENNNITKSGKMIWVSWTNKPILDENGNLDGIITIGQDINLRMKLMNELDEAKTRFEQVVANANEWVWEIDKNGLYTYVSPQIKEILGYKSDDVIGKMHFFDFFREDVKAELKQRAFSAFKQKQPFRDFINPNIDKNGNEVWLSTSGVPILSDNGEMIGYRGVDADITEKRKNERALKKSEKKFRELHESIRDAYVYCDLEKNIMEYNHVLKELIEYEDEEILSLNTDSITPKKWLKIENQMIEEQVLERGFSEIFEKEFITKTGKVIPIDIRMYLDRDPEGNPIGIWAFLHEIESRKSKEQEMQKLKRAVSNSPVSIVITNSRGNIEYVNPYFTKTTGYLPNEVIGKNPRILKSGLQPKEFYESMWKQITSGETWKSEFHNVKKNGEYYWESASISPIFDDNGEIVSFVAVKEDITERKKSEEERNKLIQELELARNNLEVEAFRLLELNNKLLDSEQQLKELNATKDKFFSIIAHDLKNPFNSLLTMTGFINDVFDQLSDEERKRILENLNLAAKSGYGLLENLLEWSRSQIGGIQYNPELSNLYELVINNITLSKSQLEKKNIKISAIINTDQFAYFDFYMIDSVVRNLISNAIKFTHEQGKITIQSIKNDNSLTVSVTDNGVGIKPEDIEKLFKIEISHSTKGTNKEKGSGLGLILANEFLRHHNSKLRVMSEVGKGTTFRFDLPLDEEIIS